MSGITKANIELSNILREMRESLMELVEMAVEDGICVWEDDGYADD